MILDSGNRTVFETGAVRDINTDKGRCDLMPLAVLAVVLDSDELALIDDFKRTGDVYSLYGCLELFSSHAYPSQEEMFLEVSKHFSEGMEKYGLDNWMKGIPLRRYVDSSVRHLLKHRAGYDDERHDRAFVWNIMCAIWTYNNKPELDDYTDIRKSWVEEMIAERRCVETTCYYNIECACTSTSRRFNPALGQDCLDYMED